MASSTAKVAARIRRSRIQSGMTQGQFARKLGISQQKLSDWENGKRWRWYGRALACRQETKYRPTDTSSVRTMFADPRPAAVADLEAIQDCSEIPFRASEDVQTDRRAR